MHVESRAPDVCSVQDLFDGDLLVWPLRDQIGKSLTQRRVRLVTPPIPSLPTMHRPYPSVIPDTTRRLSANGRSIVCVPRPLRLEATLSRSRVHGDHRS